MTGAGIALQSLRAVLGDGCLRPAAESDAAQLAALHNERATDGLHSPGVPWTTDTAHAFIERFARERWPLWVVERDGQIAAWCSLQAFSWASAACAHTVEVALHIAQRWRGRGLAGPLARFILCLAVAHGYRNLVAWVLATNGVSKRVVSALGATRWGTVPGLVRSGRRFIDVDLYGWALDTYLDTPRGRRLFTRLFGAQGA
ncbi:GNAT family N-acetyltransferase [Trinickia mobilis]|uniref:GNAT family N-acetyltransferase n=1 Tax=Trinickia mobilis TaxID=2816356 RepID=UPI001A904E29|nr:GNAT family N-acetyltransferase [Trinickia mobilis]